MHKDFSSCLPTELPAFNSSRPFEDESVSSMALNGRLRVLAVDNGDEGSSHGRFKDDMDQRVSEQMFASQSSPLNTFPPRDRFDDISAPLTRSHSQDDLSISPAAMFLTAFSPTFTTAAPLPDDEGQVVAGYKLGPAVGQGAFSTIRTATSSSGDIVAVKIVRRSDATGQVRPDAVRAVLDNEAEVWASLHHEHILPLFISEHTHYADYFVTQYCPAGSLYDILKRDGCPALPQDDVGTMFRQVVRGLQYLHEVAGFVHGDIKLENVLVDEMSVCKIGDFGMAKKITDPDDDPQHLGAGYPSQTRKLGLHNHLSLMRHNKPERLSNGLRHRNSIPTSTTHSVVPTNIYQRGSLPYASPELLLPQHDSPYRPHPAQDIWALGVLLYTLLTGRFPFADSFEPRLQMKILHGGFEIPKGIGRGAERVLLGCINTSVADRWIISMVDEVAWGIGWGDEGDDATPSEPEHKTRRSRRSVSVAASRSRSSFSDRQRSPLPGYFASRRSQSSSRAFSRNSSLSVPRDCYTSPSLSTLTMSNLSSHSTFHRPIPDSGDRDQVRGRRITKSILQSKSQSPSPSIAPMTPPDPHRSFFFPMQSRTNSDELGSDQSEFRERNRLFLPRMRSARPVADSPDIEESSRWDLMSTPAEYAWEAKSIR